MENQLMNFYNPSVTFKGAVKCDNAPSANTDLTRKQDIAGLSYISAIAAGSSSMLSVASGELSISSLAITDVHVDSTQTSLANFISNESATAASLKEGDVLILTAATGGTQTWMISGANGSSAGNYTQIESPLTAAEVGAVLTAGDGISVNAANAQISANLAAGAGLAKTVSGGQITFTVDANSDEIVEGSSNLYYTNARARTALSAGTGISYTSGSGVIAINLVGGTAIGIAGNTISFNGSTSDVSEGTNLYYTDTRSRASVSLASVSSPDAQLLTYNNSTGVFSCPASSVFAQFSGSAGIGFSNGDISFTGSTSDVSEGSRLYYTDTRSRASVSIASVSSPDAQLLTYNNSTGVFSCPASAVFAQFSGSAGIGFSNGDISFTGSTSDVSEGSRLYYTDARSRLAIAADGAAGNLLTYNNSNGQILVATSTVQGAFSAGTGLTYSNGQYALNATTTMVTEGTNLYYTDARVRAAISAGSDADELITYNSGTGSFSLRENVIRYETQVTLSAGVGTQITHNLGKKLVHTSFMDASGNQIQVAVVYNSTTALTITSEVGITIDLAVSV
jgi:hypothetical protein